MTSTAARPARRPTARASDIEARSPRGFSLELGVVIAASAALWLWFQLATRVRMEDALITARYAENLARGQGYAFNPGERVLGTTSPLHTLLLAALALPFGGEHVGAAAVLLGIAAGALSLAFLHSALRAAGMGRVATIAAVILVAVHADTLWCTVGGLETPLAIAWMTMGLDAALRRRWIRAALSAALLLLTRVDGVVWAGLLLIGAVGALRLRVWKPLAVAALAILPWLLFAWAYFGSPVPNSVIAKIVVHGKRGLVERLPWFLDSLGMTLTPVAPYGLWLALVCAGAIAALARPARPLWMLVVYPPLFALALFVVQAPWFPWYMVPVTWCAIVLAVIGAETLATALTRYGAAAGWSPRALKVGLFLIAALIGYGLVGQDLEAFKVQRAIQENEDTTRRAIGEWLRAHTRPDAVVAMEAIGYQGTYSRRKVVDLAGIVSPQVVQMRRETGSAARTFERIRDQLHPDAIVLRTLEVSGELELHDGPLFDGPAEQQRFLDEYRQGARFIAPHTSVWGQFSDLTVFVRNGSEKVLP